MKKHLSPVLETKNDHTSLTRRQVLSAGALGAVGLGTLAFADNASENVPPKSDAVKNAGAQTTRPFFALNTGTLMGFNLTIEEELNITAAAGYEGIEVWMSKVQQYLQKGGTTAQLKKLCEDLNISIINAISFPNWIVDDEKKRNEGVEQMKKEMEILAELACPYIAAPAAGATNRRIDDLLECGRRYRRILELGDSFGVIPLLETWGSSATLSRLSDAVAISVAAEHEKASLLLDAYHLYRGGNAFESLKQISGKSLKVFHLNDYPAEPAREKLNDSDRVYPGDGVAPLKTIYRTLLESGFIGAWSLELFNRSYWEKGDPKTVAETGLAKMHKALGFPAPASREV